MSKALTAGIQAERRATAAAGNEYTEGVEALREIARALRNLSFTGSSRTEEESGLLQMCAGNLTALALRFERYTPGAK